MLFAVPLAAEAAAPFTFADVQAKAQDLAGTKYAPTPPVPEFLTKLNYGEWSSIRYLPEKALWAEESLPFTVQFFHPGLYYDRPVRVHVVDGDTVEDVAFDTSLFKYENEELAQQVAQTKDMNFAGFRLHYPLNRADYKDELAIFLGASYFRALAADTHYGIYSRGLALDTATSQGEEFPYFKEFWIVKPAADAKDITIYALMDSASLAGAYRFIITPGSPTVMEVKCALFTRKGAKNFQKIGLAPLTSMFFYGEEKNGRPGDYRALAPAAVAYYDGCIELDLSKIEPTVACPHLPENTHPASDGKDIKIDQVVIGSCTNGRIEDMEAAYEILKGRHIADGVRGIIIPATMEVYKACIQRGYTTAFIDAGCIVSTPTCGPCLGGYMGILAENERCVATTNRNFVGRMGHVSSEIYLASPYVAACSAVLGKIGVID